MSFRIKKLSGSLFFSLSILLSFNTEGYALDKKVSSALSHYIMAVMYDDLGDIDKAIGEYKNTLKVDSEAPVVHLNLASSYIKKNDIAKAVEELNLAAKYDPEAIEPHAILALLYSSQNKPDLVAGEYEIALKNASKLQPKNINIYKSLGIVYLQQKKFQEARNTFKLIIDLSPSDAEAHFYLGSIYNELKDNISAEKEMLRAIELKPDYHEALNFLGYLYVEENKNLEQAQAMIRKALEIEPSNGAYVDSLGWLYFRKGKIEEAVKELEKASSLLEDPVIYDHLGDVYFKAKDTQKAKVSWEKSLKLDPDQAGVKEKLKKLDK
jgi:Tfp pilus assembly protein PilF